MKSAADVGREFDRIAVAAAGRRDAAGLYDDALLALVPVRCERALDVGCGTGRVTRMLAARAKQVTGIDISAEMLRVARQRTRARNVEYRVCDLVEAADELGAFDCVVSVAAFHHLPIDAGAAAIKRTVAAGGTLVLQDLWRVDSLADRALDGVRIPVKALRLLRARQPLWYSAAERAAWRAHEHDDRHLTPHEVVALRDAHFPGATIHKHFLWRYTLVWQT